jgi:glycosyltransferase involved in cell wall biosynthesis
LVNAVRWFLFGNTIGLFISAHLEKCYPISVDAADIAVRYFGISKKKIKICSLGVDTEFFKPPNGDSARQVRSLLRAELGFKPAEIVCIYTGRLTEDKNPLCLAKAIDILVDQGEPFRGLFVGNGSEDYIKAIKTCRGCMVHPFVPVAELPKFYWSADVGVWPKQESTSQLDAASCGLPLILSKYIEVHERVKGNGILYDEDNHFDLAEKLITLEDTKVRSTMGMAGANKVLRNFSWRKIARDRIADYENACLT